MKQIIKHAVRSVMHSTGYMLVKYRTRAGGFDVGPAAERADYAPDFEPEFIELAEQCREFTMTPPERMYNLYLAMRHVLDANIPGDIVECGVWRGGSAMLCALMLKRRGDTSRRIHLFDTFEGMVEPTEKDVDHTGVVNTHEVWARAQKQGHNEWCYASLDDVKNNMRATGLDASRCVFVQGRVEQTLPTSPPDRIALLRLDTDWHDSTLAELEHLYPRLSPGGVLLVDDYGQWRGQRDAVDAYFAKHSIRMLLARIDNAARMGIKP